MNIPQLTLNDPYLKMLVERDPNVREVLKLIDSMSPKSVEHVHNILNVIRDAAKVDEVATAVAVTYVGLVMQLSDMIKS